MAVLADLCHALRSALSTQSGTLRIADARKIERLLFSIGYVPAEAERELSSLKELISDYLARRTTVSVEEVLCILTNLEWRANSDGDYARTTF